MKIAGIICEYNPLHLGHVQHIEKTREILGFDTAVVCAMSGNFVQRGDFAVFNKHARAEAAIRCGADLVVEIPSPYVLQSAEGFAAAGVHILDSIGICEFLSFGSESGDISQLMDVAKMISSSEIDKITREELRKGISYAAANQKAADRVLGTGSTILKSANNLLGVEYLKKILERKSALRPITIRRNTGDHDGESGYSASAIRKLLLGGQRPWHLIPNEAAKVFQKEISKNQGPVSMNAYELAMLSRLRAIWDYSAVAGASEGLDRRFLKYAHSEPTVLRIMEKTKTKRYSMSRIRRMLLSTCLGFTDADTHELPPYIRILAMNQTGMKLLKAAKKKAMLPIIIKPVSAGKNTERISELFKKEANATDFYVLPWEEKERFGGQEWRKTPVVINE